MFVNQLINIASVLSNDTCAQWIRSLVTLRLDYCNSILYDLPDNSMRRLQKIILARLPRLSHISATLFDLHWLPIRYRITLNVYYKISDISSYCTILSM